MLRKFIQAGAVILLLTGTAYGQPGTTGNTSSDTMNMNMMPNTNRRITTEEEIRERQIESQYRDTVNNKIPDKKASSDPWGNVRQAAPGKATSTAKPKQP